MLFCTVSLPSLYVYDVNLRNFTLYGGREHKTTIFFFFCEVRFGPLKFMQLLKKSPTNDKLEELEYKTDEI